jgi:hypothetical protein
MSNKNDTNKAALEVAEQLPQDPVREVGQRRYRSRALQGTSARYGPCEVCQQQVSDTHLQVEERFFRHATGIALEGWTHADCRSIFGHEACLKAKRQGEYLHSIYEDGTVYDVHSSQLRLEQLRALGFTGEADYNKQQEMLTRSDEMHACHTVLVADGDWCLLQR